MAEMQRMTNSRLKAGRRCLRYHDLAYNKGYRGMRDAIYLRVGDVFHAGQEAWWSGWQLPSEPRLAGALAAIQAAAQSEKNQLDAFDLVKVEEMMRGYHFRWLDQPYAVLFVEQEFSVPLVNPDTGAASRTYTLDGKIDAGVEEQPSGRYLIVEHKSSSEDISPGSTYWKRLRMDSQVSTYMEGGRALGPEGTAPAGCVYDVVRKPKLSPYKATPPEERETTIPKYRACSLCKVKKGATPAPHLVNISPEIESGGEHFVKCGEGGTFKLPDGREVTAPGEEQKVLSEPPRYKANVRIADETPEEFRVRVREAIAADFDAYYQRGEVVRMEAELKEFASDTWQGARLIREAEVAERHPKNPDACFQWGSACQFWAVCVGEASIEDPALYQKLDDVHSELSPKVRLPVLAGGGDSSAG